MIRVYETMGRGPNVSFSTALLGWFVVAPIATGILMTPAALRSARDRLTERPATYRQFPPAGPNQPRFAQSSVACLQVLEGHHPVPATSRQNQSLGTSTNAAHQAVESNRPASTTFSSQHQAITQSSTTSPQDIQPEIERTTDLADQCQAGVDWLIARKSQSRDIMRRAMANVRENKVIHQTLINTTEAVAESVNDSTASSDQTLQDNIALTVGAVATNGRNVKAIEISTQEMQAEILMLYSRLEEAQLQLANLNARQTRPL